MVMQIKLLLEMVLIVNRLQGIAVFATSASQVVEIFLKGNKN